MDRLREAVLRSRSTSSACRIACRRSSRRRKDFEKRTQKQVKRLRNELRKNTYVKRAQGVVDDATKQVEQSVDNVLEVLHVASKTGSEPHRAQAEPDQPEAARSGEGETGERRGEDP